MTDNPIAILTRLYPGLSESDARDIDARARRLTQKFNNEADSKHSSPDKAPALWAERTTGREVSPVDFICQHYGNRSGDRSTWAPEELTRADIKRLDKSLYDAYAKHIARHTNQTLPIPSALHKIIDPVEATERRRQSARNHYAKKKLAQMNELPQKFNNEADSKHSSPDKAPALWAERTTGREVSPVDFICQHYGNRSGNRSTWDPEGLTRADIKRLDPALYQAYASWVRPGRHTEENLSLLTQPRTKIKTEKDAVAAIDRMRAKSRSWWQNQKNN